MSSRVRNIIRKFAEIGTHGIICSLPCHGDYVPKDYSRTDGLVNVFKLGITVKGWENPEEGYAAYFGIKCMLQPGKVCVVRDQKLRKVIER